MFKQQIHDRYYNNRLQLDLPGQQHIKFSENMTRQINKQKFLTPRYLIQQNNENNQKNYLKIKQGQQLKQYLKESKKKENFQFLQNHELSTGIKTSRYGEYQDIQLTQQQIKFFQNQNVVRKDTSIKIPREALIRLPTLNNNQKLFKKMKEILSQI